MTNTKGDDWKSKLKREVISIIIVLFLIGMLLHTLLFAFFDYTNMRDDKRVTIKCEHLFGINCDCTFNKDDNQSIEICNKFMKDFIGDEK